MHFREIAIPIALTVRVGGVASHPGRLLKQGGFGPATRSAGSLIERVNGAPSAGFGFLSAARAGRQGEPIGPAFWYDSEVRSRPKDA